MPLCFSSPTSPTQQPSLSRLSLFKSRVRRVFRLPSTSSSLSSSPSSTCHISSKPSLPVISPAKWSPSTESTMHSDNYHKPCRYRHSMDTIQQLEPKHPRRFSSATRLKDRLGRSASLSAMGQSKSILKTASREELQFKKQRWPSSSRRLSMPLKKKCSMLKRKSKGVSFNKMVDVFETYSKEDYDRSSDADAVCTRLTAMVAHQIKQELNYYKLNEMVVHESSRLYTHFFL
ncbi:hypothetical protein A0J61_01199 [Choanephora cucurbitarum]|uniref:Uncharacterized protein n=1 Tax=Choanephora cucurbitarum TaxID=101091 RepID=A0A1C7NP15_9FUNG|nr:hypothetical protein A0J61_01199 [Choanephora cucurbitarum]